MESQEHPLKLYDFAWMPYSDNRDDYRDHIADEAVKEEWGSDKKYLQDYLRDNFQIARLQDKVKVGPDGKYALWRAGNLTTREGEPITILALKNRRSGKQPFVYTTTFNRPRFTVKDDDGNEHPERAPEAPEYDPPPYHDDYRLTYNFSHYLEDHEARVSERLPNLNSHQRFLCIYAAAELAHRRSKESVVAVPQWYCDKNQEVGSYQWLLPLHINDEDISSKPDFVAAVDPNDDYGEYYIRTVMPPEYAYGHARAVSSRDPQFRSWR